MCGSCWARWNLTLNPHWHQHISYSAAPPLWKNRFDFDSCQKTKFTLFLLLLSKTKKKTRKRDQRVALIQRVAFWLSTRIVSSKEETSSKLFGGSSSYLSCSIMLDFVNRREREREWKREPTHTVAAYFVCQYICNQGNLTRVWCYKYVMLWPCPNLSYFMQCLFHTLN